MATVAVTEHPALVNARLAVQEDPMRLERERWLRSAGHAESLLILKAVRLCPSLDLARRYLGGERVPVSMLDQEWAKAYDLIR